MRDILISAIFAAASFWTFREIWVGALLWTWISTMNPHRLTYGFAYSLPFAFMAAGVLFLSALKNRSQIRLPADPTVVVLILFILWTCLTTAFAIHPDYSFELLIDRVLKPQVMTLLCLATLRERKHIEYFVWVLVLSLGFYGVKGGIFAIGSGGSARVWGPPGALIEGNNEIGLALVMTIPLMNYLRVTATRRWVRNGLLLSMLLSAAAAVSTQSRGAFLAIIAMGLFLWTRSQKKLAGAVVILGAAVALLAFMPASWEARMKTIQSYEQDSSALERINSWTNAVNVANDRLTGAGFAIATPEIFAKYAPDPTRQRQTAHSIYFQALGEHGWIGLFLFLALGVLSFWNASRLRFLAQERPETAWLRDLAGMVQVSMVGYAVGGAFLSLTYYDLPYNIMLVLLACKFWMNEKRWQSEKVGAFGATSGLSWRDARAGHARA